MSRAEGVAEELSETEIHKTKNRIIAVDILRVMAAFAVMYEHIVGHGACTDVMVGIYSFLLAPGTAYNCVFFLLAGYFACRNISWKKALNNAWWCLAPFALWNAIALLSKMAGGALSWHMLLDFNELMRLFGFASPEILWTDGAEIGRCFPCNYPLWFMRDLFFLFLLSPILFRFAKYIFPLMVLFAVVPCTGGWLSSFAFFPLFLNSLLFFVVGCFLRTFPKEIQTKMLQFHSGKFILFYLVLWVGQLVLPTMGCETFRGFGIFRSHALSSLLFIWVLYQIARWIEVHSSRLSAWALRLAPVTFLSFATHAIAFGMVGQLMPWVFSFSLASLVLPVALFCVLAVAFRGMKRYCRPLLHLVAHYKLRPDDMKSK